MPRTLIRNFVLLTTTFAIITTTFLGTNNASATTFTNLGPAGDYNVFVFGNNTQQGTDAQGKVAVGGTANFGSGYAVGSSLGASTDNLVVGGDLANNGQNMNGGVLVNGNLTWTNPTITGRVNVNGNASFNGGGGTVAGPMNIVGTYSRPGYYPPNAATPSVTPLPFVFNDVKTYLQGVSSNLAALTPNGTTTIFFQQVLLNAVGPTNSFYSFNVLGTDLAAAAGHGLSITAPSGSTVVVNVNGAADSFSSMGITLNGVDNQHVLYNFSQAATLSIGTIGIEGTILAPFADVNFASGAINGTMIANNLTGSGESHLHLFTGTIPVPEPATAALGLLGVAIGVGVTRVRRAARG